MPGPKDRPVTIADVMFGQTKRGFVVALESRIRGPVIVGSQVLAFELDDPSLYAIATVREFDEKDGVVYLEVNADEIHEAVWTTVEEVAEEAGLSMSTELSIA